MTESFDSEGLESIVAWVERLVVRIFVVSALSCFTCGSSVTVVVGAAGVHTVSELHNGDCNIDMESVVRSGHSEELRWRWKRVCSSMVLAIC